MKHLRTTTTAAASMALLATLTACGGTSGAATETPAAGSNRPAATSTKAPAKATPTKKADGPLKFGQSYTWTNGVTLTVSKPKAFERDQYASGGDKAKHFVRFTLTLVNGTKENLDPSMFSATMQSANAEAEPVFQEDLTGAPMTKLLPGREAKFDMGFGVADPKDLVLEVQPGFEYVPKLFTN